jgi:hypothetical protein
MSKPDELIVCENFMHSVWQVSLEFVPCSGKTGEISPSPLSAVRCGVKPSEDPASIASMTAERDIQEKSAEFSFEKNAREPGLDVPEEMEEQWESSEKEVEFMR